MEVPHLASLKADPSDRITLTMRGSAEALNMASSREDFSKTLTAFQDMCAERLGKLPLQGNLRPKQTSQFQAVRIRNANFQVDNRTTREGDNLLVDAYNSNFFASQKEKKAAVEPEGITNKQKQPHYLKTKLETFQKLYTKNQVKREQLEKLMITDRTVNFNFIGGAPKPPL